MTLLDKDMLACRMIQNNPDVTIGQYWEIIKDIKEEPPQIISSKTPIVLPVQFRQVFRIVREPLKDPRPFTRPIAKYDNRGHARLIEELS